VLASHPDAAAVHRHLARGGIWTRVFGGHPTWLRIGLPGHEAGFNRLDRALADRSAPTG